MRPYSEWFEELRYHKGTSPEIEMESYCYEMCANIVRSDDCKAWVKALVKHGYM